MVRLTAFILREILQDLYQLNNNTSMNMNMGQWFKEFWEGFGLEHHAGLVLVGGRNF